MTVAVTVAVSVLLATAGCAADDLSDDGRNDGAGGADGGSVTLASQDFPEAALVTAMYAGLLEDAGFDVTTRLVGTRAVYMQQFPGEVDVVPEYVSGIADHLNTTANGPDAEPVTTSDPQESLEAVEPLLDEAGITLLEPAEATSQNAYFVTQERADAEGLEDLSDLEGQEVVLAAAPDCEGRDDCERGLEQVYDISVTRLLPLGYGSPDTYRAVIDGEADLGQSGTLDGTLADQGLVLLTDDRGIQPAQNLVPAVGTEFLEEHPEVEGLLEALMAELDNDTLAGLITRVSVDRERPDDVAGEFLQQVGLVG